MRSRLLLAFLLIGFATDRALAAITPAAQRIVDDYLAATGSRAAFESERTLHAKGRIVAGGASGSFETWTQFPCRTFTSIRLGSTRIESGCDGTTAWRTDAAGRRRVRLEGAELDQAIADAYFQNELWARPDQGGGRVVANGQAFGDDGILRALEVTPPRGVPRRLWFSKTSGLLVRVARRHGNGEWVERYSDYRRSSGRIRAHACESGTARDVSSYQRFVVDSAWVNGPVDSAWFTPPEKRAGAIGFRARSQGRGPSRAATLKEASASTPHVRRTDPAERPLEVSSTQQGRCSCGTWLGKATRCRRCT